MIAATWAQPQETIESCRKVMPRDPAKARPGSPFRYLARPRGGNGIQVACGAHRFASPGDAKSGCLSIQGSHRCAIGTPVGARGARGLRL
jgi:hypothetical protein